MTGDPDVSGPVQRFVDDLAAIRTVATVEGPRVMYDVAAIGGGLAGTIVRTGVSISELQSWPLAPPHWVHLPASITFALTNTDTTDCAPGWIRHSREFGFTSTSVPPALAWLRHVRGLVSLALPRTA